MSDDSVREKLAKFLSEDEIGIWLEQPHLLLSNQSPSDFIRAGRDDEVHRLIDLIFDNNHF